MSNRGADEKEMGLIIQNAFLRSEPSPNTEIQDAESKKSRRGRSGGQKGPEADREDPVDRSGSVSQNQAEIIKARVDVVQSDDGADQAALKWKTRVKVMQFTL